MEELICSINKFREDGINLFYNSKGHDLAYKLFVRHIGYAPVLGYGRILNGILKLEKDIYIVDFEKEEIDFFLKNNEIEVVFLENLE